MSTTPHSPPETPSKQAMALGNEGVNHMGPHTPARDAQSKRGNNRIGSTMEVKSANSSPGQNIKVSATQEPNILRGEEEEEEANIPAGERNDGHKDGSSDDEPEDDDDDIQAQHGELKNEHVKESQVEEIQIEASQVEASQVEAESPVDDNLEFDAMDWGNFRKEYEEAILKADQDEDALREEFNFTCDAFAIWAEASGARDNVRATKRLRTRETLVQISEDKLKKRRDHYFQVVDAFKKALELME